MTFLEHLEELRRRLIYCVVAVCGGIVVCWIFREEIRAFLEAPLYTAWSRVEGLPPSQPLSFTSLVEPFMAYLKLSAIGGVFLAVPAILYNIWKFVAPGLYKRERRIALPFVFVSSLLFLGGSTLCYTYVFPLGIQFFLGFAAGGTAEDLTASAVTARPAAVAEPAVEAPTAPPEPEPAAEPSARGEGDPDAGAAGEGDGGVVATRGDPDPAPEPAAAPVETPKAAAPPEEPAGDPAPSPQKSLWDVALEKFLRKGCGELTAAADASGAAVLRYAWHSEECGAIPELRTLSRDGAVVEAEWAKIEGAKAGYAVFEVRDAPDEGGPHEYLLHTLSRGEAGRKLAPILMLSEYLSFSIKLLFAFGILFELPVLIVFLSLAGLVDHKQLLKFSRWFIVLALIAGAVMTTPDVITQVMFAGPLIVLYFVSVLIAYFIERKRAT